MPRKSLASEEKVAKAVSLLMKAPKLTVREAMLAAEFAPSETDNKTMQRKVARSLPGHTKRGMIGIIPPSTVGITSDDISGVSPLTDPSTADKENLSPSPPRKLKKQRMNSRQVQDKQEADLIKKTKYSKAHKAATTLYFNEREKEKGLTLRNVEPDQGKAQSWTECINNLPLCCRTRPRWNVTA